VGSDVIIPEIVVIERSPWHPMPSCPFGLSCIVYPPSASWLMALGADGRFGPTVQFMPLLLAMILHKADLEFRPNE